jgi:hypothetical protein
MPRSYILLALLGSLATSYANAQSPPQNVLEAILQEMLVKRYEDLNYIFPQSSPTSPRLERFFVGPSEPYVIDRHHNLNPMADQSRPIYPVIAQFTVLDRSGRPHRMEKDYYCFVTYDDDWSCSPWGVTEREVQ